MSLALLLLWLPLAASASNYNPGPWDTEELAYSACQEYLSSNFSAYDWRCVDEPDAPPATTGDVRGYSGFGTEYVFLYNHDSPPPNLCHNINIVHTSITGKISNGDSICMYSPPDDNGHESDCKIGYSDVSPPTQNPNTGNWNTYVTASPTGSLCGEGPDAADPGTGVGPVTGPSGDPISPQPPITPNPPDLPNPPKLCSNFTCFDPGDNRSCAAENGTTFCSPPGGGCTTSPSGASTICSGSPMPPAPPPGAVPNPPAQIGGCDSLNQQNPNTGAPSSTTSCTYGPTGSPPTNGQGPGDSGPAPASSAGGDGKDKGSYGGGTDCNTPPACSGDTVACGAARTEWATMCQVHKDLSGDGPPTDFDTLKTQHQQSELWTDAPTSPDSSVGGQANAGNYDRSGFGYSSSCPLTDMEVPFVGNSISIPLSKVCVVGPWVRAFVIAFALFAAAKITWAGKVS